MPTEGAPPRPPWILAVAALVAMASGLVVGLGDIASVPLAIVLTAALAFIGSIAVFAGVTYRDARASGSTYGSALRQSLRTAGRVLMALMP